MFWFVFVLLHKSMNWSGPDAKIKTDAEGGMISVEKKSNGTIKH